jgi:hypothetical protein
MEEVKPIKRHPAKMLAKARTHLVMLDDPRYARYKVYSGGKVKPGGNEYIVNVFKNGGAGCNCDWAMKRQDALTDNKGATACSHTIAVFEFIAEGQGKKVSAWESPEQAERQHRPVTNMTDGVVLTARVIPHHYVQATFFAYVDRVNR